MAARRTYRIGDVSKIARVSIRTLHYYDEIGLLAPGVRTDAGYRLYTDDDLLRLQQILIGRELGFALEDIRRSLDDPTFDRRASLLEQRRQLERQAADTAAMLAAIDVALAIMNADHKTNDEEGCMENIFEGFDPSKYEHEARERWGDTSAYKEAARRTQGYTADDWKRIKSENEAVYAEAIDLMKDGAKPTDEAAMAVAERHRLQIERWFYPCSHGMHRGLADMYESDERFSAAIDSYGAGLTSFLAAAIRANSTRQSTSTEK